MRWCAIGTSTQAQATLLVLCATLCGLPAVGVLPIGPAVTPAAAIPCPLDCQCVQEPQNRAEYQCIRRSGNLTLNTGYASKKKYLVLHCDSGTFHCAELPSLTDVANTNARDIISSLQVVGCTLPAETLACSLRALGADPDSLQKLYVTCTPPNTVQHQHFHELSSITKLTLENCFSGVGPFSLPALETLPSLRTLRVKGGTFLLQPNALAEASSLQWLEFSNCSFIQVPIGAFRGLRTLKTLGLWGNKIEKVIPGAFDGLASLTEVDLGANAIRVLSMGTFAGAPKIRSISLVENPLDELETGAFEGLQELNKVTISIKGTSRLKLGEKVFADLPALKILYLDNCRLETLPKMMLSGSAALEELNLERNFLEELPDSLLNDQTSLVTLNLKHNRIKTLAPDVFSSLGRLKQLDLSRNLIEDLPEGLFRSIGAAVGIDVSSNRLRTVYTRTFPAVSALRRLNLARNLLALNQTTLANLTVQDDLSYLGRPSPFANLRNLTRLDLSRNLIQEMYLDWKFMMPVLLTLNLSSNRFDYLSEYEINFAQSKVTVDLRNNSITSINLYPADDADADLDVDADAAPVRSRALIDSTAFNCNCTLLGLVQRLRNPAHRKSELQLNLTPDAVCATPSTLAGRPLRDLSPYELTCDLRSSCTPQCHCQVRPANLTLELECDKLPPPHVFGVLDNRGISFATLRLKVAPLSLANLSPRVTVLRLNGLGIKAVPPLPVNLTLEELDLTDNELEYVPREMVKAGAPYLRLAGNPLACDCWRADDLAALQRYRERVRDEDRVRCADGASVWSVDAVRLCDVWTAAGVGAVLAALGLAAAGAAYLLQRYRVELRVFLYNRGWCLRISDDDDDLEYDAFLCFAHRDHWFVVDEILAELENGPHPYKVCVHFRDWTVGDWVPTLIEKSIDRSRRTIVIVTEAFLASTWSRLEFRAAHERSLRDGRPRLVVVLVDDRLLDHPRLDPDLHAYLRTNSYVKWGEKRFWGRLHAALSRGHHTRPLTNLATPYDPAGVVRKVKGALDVVLAADGTLYNRAALNDYKNKSL